MPTRINYSELVAKLNSWPPEPVFAPHKNIRFDIYNGSYSRPGPKYTSLTDFARIPAKKREIKAEYIIPDPTYEMGPQQAHLFSFLETNNVRLEDQDTKFVGGYDLLLCLFPSMRMAIFSARYLIHYANGISNTPLLPVSNYACVLFTNNYEHGIVLLKFPKCAHIHLIGTQCFVQHYESILDAIDSIKQMTVSKSHSPHNATTPMPPPRYLNAPTLPFKIALDNMLGSGTQGSVFMVDKDRVVKIIQIGFPSVSQSDLHFEERAALNETLIMYYLQSKNFQHAPRPLKFGYFNGVFFYILMTKVDGHQPATNSDYRLCQESVDELHQMGVLHTDLHAGNLLIREKQSNCILLDFGYACLISERPDDVADDVVSIPNKDE